MQGYSPTRLQPNIWLLIHRSWRDFVFFVLYLRSKEFEAFYTNALLMYQVESYVRSTVVDIEYVLYVNSLPKFQAIE